MLEDFKKFVIRGNMVDMAIGFTVGAAFSTVVKSLVDDMIMPPIALILGQVEFSDLFLLLRPGDPGPPYKTLAEAQAAGAVTLNYGRFINNLVALLIIALAMFLIIRAVNRLEEELGELFGDDEIESAQPTTKTCPYCLAAIPFQATRCQQCTSSLTPAGSQSEE